MPTVFSFSLTTCDCFASWKATNPNSMYMATVVGMVTMGLPRLMASFPATREDL